MTIMIITDVTMRFLHAKKMLRNMISEAGSIIRGRLIRYILMCIKTFGDVDSKPVFCDAQTAELPYFHCKKDRFWA